MKLLVKSVWYNIVTCLFMICSCENGMSQEKDKTDTALIPFWQSTTLYNESVLMIEKNGELPSASLLFKPDTIRSVRNAALNMEYREGVDWEYKKGKLWLLKNSNAVFMTQRQLYPDSTVQSFPGKGGGRIRFSEGSFFHEQQLAVTYTHSPNQWKGPVPRFQGKRLSTVIHKLKSRRKVKLLLFGDSIAAGANASGENNTPPYMPSWGSLIAEKLRRYYGDDVIFTNTAVGGMDSKWGIETVKENVIAHHPDLVIIAFGMNDGTLRMDPKLFKENIRRMINKVKQDNPATEFILVSTMLPNPESEFVGTQLLFKKVLNELTGQRIVLVDMSGVHAELLKHKSYQDMTGNNINHPNDFLIRWYAQQILSVLIPHNSR